MPIENERKFVLEGRWRPGAALVATPGVTRSFLRQAYLDVSGMRIRSVEGGGAIRHVFTYKRPVDGQMVEIETEISADRIRSAVVAAARDSAEGALLLD